MIQRHLFLLTLLLTLPFLSCSQEPSETQSDQSRPGEVQPGTTEDRPDESQADEPDSGDEETSEAQPDEAVANKDPSSLAFTKDEAVARQKECSESLEKPVEMANSIEMKLILIPPGEFLMGSPEPEEQRETGEYQHRVQITKPFYLGVYEVTQAEYERVMEANPSGFSEKGGYSKDVEDLDTSGFPVETVSWEDAVAFCRKLSDLPEEKAAGRIYRLPTEAEWEYACRAGTVAPFHFGAELNGEAANCRGDLPYGTSVKGPCLKRPTKVGSYAPNAFGLYDMHGNVFELCHDWHEENYYRESQTDDPQGPAEGSRRVRRGGSWSLDARLCRSAYRNGSEPSFGFNSMGFRVAHSPSGEQEGTSKSKPE